MIKPLVRGAFRMLGYEMRKISTPSAFGVEWTEDVRHFLGDRRLGTAFDVGANIGQTVRQIDAAFPGCRIWSFEPGPPMFAELQANTAGMDHVTPVNMALGQERGDAELRVGRRSGLSRISSDADASDPAAETYTIQVDTLASQAERFGLEHIDLLKIDVESFEMPVLAGAEAWLSEGRIDFVLVECDFIRRPDQPHTQFGTLYDFLHRLGYNVVGFYTHGVDDLGWVWGDVLFKRARDCEPGRLATAPHRFAR